MRVLINGSFAQSLVNFRGDLICSLVDRGYEVHVSAPSIDASTREKLMGLEAVVHEVQLDRTGSSIISDLKYFFQLRSLIKEHNIDFTINYTIKPNIYGSLAAASAKSTSISMVTGLGYTFYEARNLKQKVLGFVSRTLYRLATGVNKFVIFQNMDDREDFIAAGCLRDPRKARMTNGSGVNTTHFDKRHLPEKPVFLLIARLLVHKGVREYAAAAKQVMAQNTEAVFLLAGFIDEGPDSIAEQELAEWQSDGVQYLGSLDDIRDAMEEASVFVLPAYREGTPRTVLEAMAMGRPIITTDAPGCRETVIEGETGFLVPVKDPNKLAQKMAVLANDAELRAKMGDASYRYCTERFEVNKVNTKLLKDVGLF